MVIPRCAFKNGKQPMENSLFLDCFRAADCGLRTLLFADVTCETCGIRGTFSSFELACVRRIVLPYHWLNMKK